MEHRYHRKTGKTKSLVQTRAWPKIENEAFVVGRGVKFVNILRVGFVSQSFWSLFAAANKSPKPNAYRCFF
jgi:hypothetical protein